MTLASTLIASGSALTRSAQAAFTAAGAKLIRVPVDEHGLDPARLPSDKVPVRAIYVTPSHQFPTGAVMPASTPCNPRWCEHLIRKCQPPKKE